jgi:hypothetical protein
MGDKTLLTLEGLCEDVAHLLWFTEERTKAAITVGAATAKTADWPDRVLGSLDELLEQLFEFTNSSHV